MFKWSHFPFLKTVKNRHLERGLCKNPFEHLSSVVEVLQATTPKTRPVIGHLLAPRFLENPPIGLTRELISGVSCDEVYPNIFVGDEGSARKTEFLKAVGITHVLNTAEGSSYGQVNTNAKFYDECKIKYLGMSLIDAPRIKISDHFEEGISFIDDAIKSGGKILVHCLMGLSRSATITAAYLIVKKKMTATQALKTLRQQREVRPNEGFVVQLIQLDQKQRGKKPLNFDGSFKQ